MNINIVFIFVVLETVWDVSRAAVSCDFEKDFCTWSQLKSDKLDWLRSSNSTPDRTSGPDHDHTTGSGYYAYVSSSHARIDIASGGLISPIIVTSKDTTLGFWYHMNGNGIGSLAITRNNQPRSDNKGQEIWKTIGRQGATWHYASIQLQPGTFTISILATSRLHHGSDIAIDDVVFVGHAQVITFPPLTTTPAPVYDISVIPCNFEQDFCKWRQDTDDQFDWTRGSADTPDKTSGPSGDHTTGNGHYAYINGHGILQANWTSRMTSRKIRINKEVIFRFWYHMNGHGIGSLQVLNLLGAEGNQVIFEKTKRVGPNWQEARLLLQPGFYVLAIQATARLHYSSDIAIDDISVIDKAGPIG